MPKATAGAQDGPKKVETRLSAMPRTIPRHQGARDRSEPGEDRNREHLADVEPADRRLDRDDDDQQRACQRGGADADAEAELLDLDRIGAHELQRQAILRHGLDRTAVEGARHVEIDDREHGDGDAERHEHAGRHPDPAGLPALPDVGGLHGAEVDAVDHDERDLDDEHDAEKEGEAAQRFIVFALETLVVKTISAGSDDEEYGNEYDSCQNRVQPPQAVAHVGDVRAKNDERRMGDIDDVELPERDRQPEADRGIEAAEQHAGD